MKNIKGALFSSSIVFLLLSLAVLVFSFRNLGKWLMVSDPLPGHLTSFLPLPERM